MSSYASTSRSTPTSSPALTPSRPISFSSSTSSNRSSFSSSTSTTTSNPYSTCAYPSWPSGSSFLRTSHGAAPSGYVSDAELFGGENAYLREAPPPPRPAEAYLARPLLPPVAQFKPTQCSTEHKKKRRSTSSKVKG